MLENCIFQYCFSKKQFWEIANSNISITERQIGLYSFLFYTSGSLQYIVVYIQILQSHFIHIDFMDCDISLIYMSTKEPINNNNMA